MSEVANPEELHSAARPQNGNGDDHEPCLHGGFEVKINGRSEPRRLACVDCGQEWEVRPL